MAVATEVRLSFRISAPGYAALRSWLPGKVLAARLYLLALRRSSVRCAAAKKLAVATTLPEPSPPKRTALPLMVGDQTESRSRGVRPGRRTPVSGDGESATGGPGVTSVRGRGGDSAEEGRLHPRAGPQTNVQMTLPRTRSIKVIAAKAGCQLAVPSGQE